MGIKVYFIGVTGRCPRYDGILDLALDNYGKRPFNLKRLYLLSLTDGFLTSIKY